MIVMEQQNQSGRLSFSTNWDILGPFQIGTRETEASWGADPLEYIGGFRSLQNDPTTCTWYHSSLAADGKVSWSSSVANILSSDSESVAAVLKIEFPAIDWESLRSIYGWAAFQYQAWARGNLVVHGVSNQSVLLFTDNVVEFWVDDQLYFGGDFYANRKAPLILHLDPGLHQIDIRLIRDDRVMGGNREPSIQIKLEAQKSRGSLVVDSKPVIPDIVNGRLASNLASVYVRNEERSTIDILQVQSADENFALELIHPTPTKLLPGQSRPLAFKISKLKAKACALSFRITFILHYSSLSVSLSYHFSSHSIRSPHKFTYLLPSGIVSYSILRAPAIESSHNQDLPVLLNLHGADLEADSHQVRHMLDSVPNINAWVIFPSGVTPWSGDDWHTWGFADVKAGVAAIGDWIQTVEWEGALVNLNRWLVSGHSNGGQGTWYALTHYPDNIIGGAPISGYSSIQAYVPYTFWSNLEPRVTSLLQSSLIDFQHELLVDNLAGIPLQQQHGSVDDNVSVYHSRRMSELIHQCGWFSDYAELEGKGHWFDGVMATIPLCKFYDLLLKHTARKPNLPQNFTFHVANPANTGSRGGLVVDQLMVPGQIGRLDVDQDATSKIWKVRSSNILRFHFVPLHYNSFRPVSMEIDGYLLDLVSEIGQAKFWIVRSGDDGSWQISCDAYWQSLNQRYGGQLGPLDSILRTKGKFAIRTRDKGDLTVPLQVSRNLLQYFGADTEIFDREDSLEHHRGNVISIEKGPEMSSSTLSSYPIYTVGSQGIWVRNANDGQKCYRFEKGMGAILLRPLPDERLELMIWGYDDNGLRQAARLLPMMTGVGQPEFVIVSRESAWKGVGGVLAMGSFSSFWDIPEAASYSRY